MWLAILGALVVASCDTAATVHEGGYRIATAAPEANLLSIFGGKAEAQVNGDGSACVSIVWRTSHTAIVWPTGYTARGNPLAVYDRNGKQVLVAGQNFSGAAQSSLGGGQVLTSRARRVAGCSGFSQSVAFVPTPSATIATPGLEEYNELQISEMQTVINLHRDVFGGVVADPSSHIVTIFVASTADPVTLAQAKASLLDAAVPSPYSGSLQHWRVGFVVAGPSLATLDVVLNRVEIAQPWRNDVGTNLLDSGIDQARHRVSIGVLEITPTISGDALAAFGNLVILETAEPAIAV
jgi:hypothetical protein